jgi:hypothetical protein
VSPFLTDEEIANATEPLTQGAARIKFFERLGVKVKAKPNGQPLVWRCDFELRRQQAANDGRPASRDWTAFEKRVRCGRDGAKA